MDARDRDHAMGAVTISIGKEDLHGHLDPGTLFAFQHAFLLFVQFHLFSSIFIQMGNRATSGHLLQSQAFSPMARQPISSQGMNGVLIL